MKENREQQRNSTLWVTLSAPLHRFPLQHDTPSTNAPIIETKLQIDVETQPFTAIGWLSNFPDEKTEGWVSQGIGIHNLYQMLKHKRDKNIHFHLLPLPDTYLLPQSSVLHSSLCLSSSVHHNSNIYFHWGQKRDLQEENTASFTNVYFSWLYNSWKKIKLHVFLGKIFNDCMSVRFNTWSV